MAEKSKKSVGSYGSWRVFRGENKAAKVFLAIFAVPDIEKGW